MIVFIDDEKWTIEGYLLEFDNEKKQNPKYEYKHFFYPIDAKKYLEVNYRDVDLIILDIALDYGDGNILNKVDGGIQFLNEVKESKDLNHTPILIYSVRPKGDIERDSELNLEKEKYIFYLNRDCKDEKFYKEVKKILNRSFFKG